MSERTHCDELLQVLGVMEQGLRSPFAGISPDDLNHVFAPHKMTIGQIAVHAMAWPRYFLSEEPPWEVDEWTCRPCDYPLTPEFVSDVISDGVAAIRDTLQRIDDAGLARRPDGEAGPGYIICRLMHHTMVHACQMAYLRQLLEPDWEFEGHFGHMATALIRLPYHTEPPQQRVRGF